MSFTFLLLWACAFTTGTKASVCDYPGDVCCDDHPGHHCCRQGDTCCGDECCREGEVCRGGTGCSRQDEARSTFPTAFQSVGSIVRFLTAGNTSLRSRRSPSSVMVGDPGSCAGIDWPQFPNAQALQADPWGKYFQTVYGELPSTFPLAVENLWMLYNNVVSSAGVTNIPAVVGKCPLDGGKGQRYSENNRYSPGDLSWIWHPYPYLAIKADSWVEVMHQADPFGDEHFGAWFLYAPGSGIYFNVGNTMYFQTHQDAYASFGVKSGDLNELLSKAAAKTEIDSIQFTAHVDHTNYPCDTGNTGVVGLDYMGFEIVGTKLTGTYSCTAASGAPPLIKSGWQASKPCVCSNSNQFLNCQGVPSLTDTVLQRSSEANGKHESGHDAYLKSSPKASSEAFV